MNGNDILSDVQLIDLDRRDAEFTRAALIDEINKAISAAVQAEREAYNAIADGYDKRRKELLLHPNRDYHLYADALGEAATDIRARDDAQQEAKA